MKLVSSWPDYSRSQIIAITEAGEVFALPVLDNGRLFGTEWLRLAPAQQSVQRFEDGLARYRERSNEEPKLLLLSPRDFDRMGDLYREGVRFPMYEGKSTVVRFNGIELGPHPGIEDGTVAICDEKLKVLGTFAWLAK